MERPAGRGGCTFFELFVGARLAGVFRRFIVADGIALRLLAEAENSKVDWFAWDRESLVKRVSMAAILSAFAHFHL